MTSALTKKRSIVLLSVGLIALILYFFLENDAEIKKVAANNMIVETQLEAGNDYSMYLDEQGNLWAWGRNEFGTLAQGDLVNRTYPVKVQKSFFNNEKILKIRAGHLNALVLTETGKLYAWGKTYGNKPRLIYEDTEIKDIAIGGHIESTDRPVIFLIMENGTIKVSGSSQFGTFGNGLRSDGSLNNCQKGYITSMTDFSNNVLMSVQTEPCPNNSGIKKQVEGTATLFKDAKKISPSLMNSKVLALTENNELYVWGNITSSSVLPVKLKDSELYIIEEIVYGMYPMFLADDGKVFYYPTISGKPKEIILEGNNSKAVQITASESSYLILDEKGRLYGIGDNEFGNLGPNISSAGVPISLGIAKDTGIDGVESVTMGLDHTLVHYQNQKLASFGRNAYGGLGKEIKNTKTNFTKNPNLSNIDLVYANNKSSYASLGSLLYSWGGAEKEYLLGRSGAVNAPGIVKDFKDSGTIIEMEGFSESYTAGSILLSDGSIWNFDNNYRIATGTENRANFTLGKMNNFSSYEIPETFISSVQGGNGGVAIGSDKRLYSWGNDSDSGLLGFGYKYLEIINGEPEAGGLVSFQKVKAPENEEFTKVYGKFFARVALTDSGNVYVWGRNSNSRFGSLVSTVLMPTKIPDLPFIKEIAIGRNHSLFLDENGGVWSVGDNSWGALGLGDTKKRSIPTKISSLSNIKHIFAGDTFSFALSENGELFAFGDNREGQLGLGDRLQRNEPRLVPGVSNVKFMSAGKEHTLLLTNSGDVYVAGSDGEGQLGLSQSQSNPEPEIITFPPVLTMESTDNVIYENKDTGVIKGVIDAPNVGGEYEVAYSIESSKGTTTHYLKTYISSSDVEPFFINIPLKDYSLGGYTVVVKAVARNGSKGQAALNFSVGDKTLPTVKIDKMKIDKWSQSLASIEVTADDQGGSGYRGYRYMVNSSTSKPTEWSEIKNEKIGVVEIDKDGIHYLHIEAYDQIGNITYLRGGPYHLDISLPTFRFAEPEEWQQDKLNLSVIAEDISGIEVVKWLQGSATKEELKTNGNEVTNESLEVSMNGIYSFYAKDNNGQESIATYEVKNINKKPYIDDVKEKVIIPYSENELKGRIPLAYSHLDESDPVKAKLEIVGQTFESTNEDEGIWFSKPTDFEFRLSDLTSNIVYDAELSVNDSRDGLSIKENIQIEIYKPELTATTRKDNITLNWIPSKIGERYQLLKDGEEVYNGIDTSFVDSTIRSQTNYYQLKVWNGNEYILVDTINKESGSVLFETPKTLIFPNIKLSSGVNNVTANDFGTEFVKYEDYSDVPTAYSLNVSVTDFVSSDSSFEAESLVFKQVKKLSRTDTALETKDIYLSKTPIEIVGVNETAVDSYKKLEILKENVTLTIPGNIQLNSGTAESFTSEIIWEIRYTP